MKAGQPTTRPRVTLAVLVGATVTYALMHGLITPALPVLQHELHTNQATVAYLYTAFLLSSAVSMPVLGRVADLHGKRRVLLGVLATFACGTLVCALATDIRVMLAGRVLQGVAAAILPISYGIVREQMSRDRLSSVIGALSAMLAVGGAAGLVLAGPIVTHLSYHWLSWLPLIMSVVTLAAALKFVPESNAFASGPLGWASAVPLSVWLVAALLTFTGAAGRGLGPTVLVVGVGALAAVVWFRVELTAEHPLVDLRLMRSPAIWRANLSAFLFGTSMFSMNLLFPTFLQVPRSNGYGFGAGVGRAGMLLLPLAVMIFVAGLATGPIERRFGSAASVVTGSLLLAAGLGGFGVWNDHLWQLFVALVLCGAGQGLAFAALTNAVVEAAPVEQSGVAAAANLIIRTLGGSFGGQLAAGITGAGLVVGQVPSEHRYVVAFLVVAGTAILAAAVAAFLPRGTPATHAHPVEWSDAPGVVAGLPANTESHELARPRNAVPAHPSREGE